MAGQNVEIRLGFTADVSQAKQQMGQLQSELQRLSTTPIKGPEGNIEYLLHMKKLDEAETDFEYDFDIHQIVENSHKSL